MPDSTCALLTAEERVREAKELIGFISQGLSYGWEFTSPKSSEFFTGIRAKHTQYKDELRVSAGQLEWLRDIRDRMLKIKRPMYSTPAVQAQTGG